MPHDIQIDVDAFDFGMRIRELRKNRGWTQEEFSRMLGVHKDMISKYENNLKTPSLDRVVRMAQIFHVSIDYLLGLEKVSSSKIYGLSKDEKLVFDNFFDQLFVNRN